MLHRERRGPMSVGFTRRWAQHFEHLVTHAVASRRASRAWAASSAAAHSLLSGADASSWLRWRAGLQLRDEALRRHRAVALLDPQLENIRQEPGGPGEPRRNPSAPTEAILGGRTPSRSL